MNFNMKTHSAFRSTSHYKKKIINHYKKLIPSFLQSHGQDRKKNDVLISDSFVGNNKYSYWINVSSLGLHIRV